MQKSYYGFAEKPFSLLLDPKYFYIGNMHRKAFIKLRSGVMSRAGFTLITGDSGCGKTALVQYLKDRLRDDITIGIISNTSRTFVSMQLWVLNAFGVKYEGSADAAPYQLFEIFVKEQFKRQLRSLLFVDEAQNLDIQQLEELRLLLNVNGDEQMFQIILVGQPELRDMLRRPDMLQFVQRITVEHHLEPLDSEDTYNYIVHRISVAGGDPSLIERQACDLIYKHSRGVPRLINSLCDTALLYGYKGNRKTIDSGLINEIMFNANRYDSLGTETQELAASVKINEDNRIRSNGPIPWRRHEDAKLAKLVVAKEGKLLNEYLLDVDCLTIGRAQENAVRLPDSKVSRTHARIVDGGPDGHRLEDLTSLNGTYVNGKRIAEYPLKEGDIVKIHNYQISYQLQPIK